jgi:Holliday junction resolvase
MTKNDNRTTGGRFEQELAEVLAAHGFWVHVLQQNKAGQPADIIAIRGKFHTLIDCKVCDSGVFPFERVEENQRMAMKMFFNKTGELSYFALRLPNDSVRMIPYTRIETLKNRGKKRLSKEDMETETWDLAVWLDSSKTWAEDT